MEIFGALFLVLAFLLVLVFYGLFALFIKNWLVIMLLAFHYWFFRKRINTYIQKLWKKRIYRILIVIVSVFFFIVLLLVSISSAMTRYSNKVYSPDRKYYVQITEVNGGATTAFQTSVSIADAKYIFNNLDIISYRTGHKQSVLFFKGSLDSATPTWIDNQTLKITYDCAGLYDDPVTKWKDIKIIFEEKCEQ